MKLSKIVIPLCIYLGTISQGSFAQTNITKLEKQVEQLHDEVAFLQEQLEETTVANSNRMSISGYTDLEYRYSTEENFEPGFRLHHLSFFFEKNLSEDWKFFSEIEYEDAPKFESEGQTVEVDDGDPNTDNPEAAVFKDANGKIFVEAVNFTYFFNPKLNFRGGRFFTPAGIWSVDHYPPFVGTQIRPAHIRNIFPQVVDGVTLFGTFPMGNTFLNYDLYMGNGENATGKQDNNSEKASGLKFAFLFPTFKYFEFGGTVYQDTLKNSKNEDTKLALGAHMKMKFSLFTLQGEYANGTIDKMDGSSYDRIGYYGQLQMDTRHWTLGARYDYYDEDNTDNNSLTTNSAFINYHVTESIVVKLEHHLYDQEDVTKEDFDLTIGSVVLYLGN